MKLKTILSPYLWLSSLALPLTARPVAAAEQKPNIIFVVLDDLDWLHSGPLLPELMPFLSQKTSEEGVLFEAAHSAAICCEARAAILTGLYAHNNGVFTNGGRWGGYEAFRNPKDGWGRERKDAGGQALDNELRTIAVHMQKGGYHTGMFGKYLNGFELQGEAQPELPLGWDSGSVYVDPGLNSYAGYGYKMLSWADKETAVESFGFLPKDYGTDVLSEKAEQFLALAQHEPKFLYLSYTAPHFPLAPAPRHLASSWRWVGTEPRTANIFQDGTDGFVDKPQWLQSSLDQRLRPELKAWMRHDWANRLGSLRAVDEGLQRLWTQLERSGEADHSIVVVTSDNGYNNGAHGLIHKMAPYEETLRVPLLMFAGKDIAMTRGKRVRAWTSHVDFFPTFLDLAKLPQPREVDGLSLKSLMTETERPMRSELLFSYQGGEAANGRQLPIDFGQFKVLGGLAGFVSDVPTHFGLKKIFALGPELRQFKLIAWPKQDQALFFTEAWEQVEWELYDLDRDPHELHNLWHHAPAACAALKQEMEERLRQLFVCTGEACHQGLEQADAKTTKAVQSCP